MESQRTVRRMSNRWELSFRNSLATYLGIFLPLVLLASPAIGLKCYQCGQYTDGPGSITPCLNYTDAQHLKECPSEANKQCIKYVNEASTVRDCADECNEKRSDSGGTSVYCCWGHGCNSASSASSSAILVAIAVWNHFRLPGVASG